MSLYIDLLKQTLTDIHRVNLLEYKRLRPTTWKLKLLLTLDAFLRGYDIAITSVSHPNFDTRYQGRDYPANADTMIGMARLNNLEDCINIIVNDNIPGDFIETGAWRGGACILMKAMLKERSIVNRIVWVADSFEGLPKPDGRYSQDKPAKLYKEGELAISLEEVMQNFIKYDLLDDKVKFLKGWFKDTLPLAPIQQLAVLRLDGDLYSSTLDALTNLYHKLSPGGFCIVDDYGAVPGCMQAVDEFRNAHDIKEPIIKIDWAGIYWRKS